MPVFDVIETLCDVVLIAPLIAIDDCVALNVNACGPEIAPLNVNAPVPVCCSVVTPLKVTGAPNVAVDPCVVLDPVREKAFAVMVSVPDEEVGPMVTPCRESVPPAAENV